MANQRFFPQSVAIVVLCVAMITVGVVVLFRGDTFFGIMLPALASLVLIGTVVATKRIDRSRQPEGDDS
jgi:hypothetical protein